jgi:hypothetical protein
VEDIASVHTQPSLTVLRFILADNTKQLFIVQGVLVRTEHNVWNITGWRPMRAQMRGTINVSCPGIASPKRASVQS